MSAPFYNFFADEFKVSAPNVRALIENCRTTQKTGLFRFVSTEGKALYLLLKKGLEVNCYLVSSGNWRSTTLDAREDWIDSAGIIRTKYVSLSAAGLLVCKLLIQNTMGEKDTLKNPVEVGEYLEAQKKSPKASISYLDWGNSMGAVLFSGASSQPHSIFVASDTVYDEIGIVPPLQNPEHSNCVVTAADFDPMVEAWQEVLLQRVFINVCEQTLVKLQALTGQSLVASLTRLVNAFASRRNLNIEIVSRKVTDNELFASPQQAADNYRLLLTEMLIHFSGITGSHFLSNIVRDIVVRLPVEEHAILKAFPLFTEGYVYERRN